MLTSHRFGAIKTEFFAAKPTSNTTHFTRNLIHQLKRSHADKQTIFIYKYSLAHFEINILKYFVTSAYPPAEPR